jgi:hypothetical protein
VGPDGDLYLRGGGDFTFGTASFARRACGTPFTLVLCQDPLFGRDCP